VTNDYIKTGSPIYARSFEIIREESNLARFPEDVEPVVVRMIHAAADPAIADLIAFTPGVAAAALKALEAGAPILCDSSMVATGIIRSRLPEHTRIVCHIKDPRLPAIAEAKGCTKTAAAVDLWQEDGLLDGAVVAIGNAPTALFRVLEVMHETGARPAAIVGIPVGFVGAAESKDALVADDSGVEYITVLGRRGGSAMAVGSLLAYASVLWGYNLNGRILDSYVSDPATGYRIIFMITAIAAGLGCITAVVLDRANRRAARLERGRETVEPSGNPDNPDEAVSAAVIEDEVERRRARHAVYENRRTLEAVEALEKNDVKRFGALMNDSHVSLRDDYEVTGPELDTLAELAWQQEGVLGSRMTGGGFAGCTVSIVRDEAIPSFEKNVAEAYTAKIGYAPSFYVANIADGARRL